MAHFVGFDLGHGASCDRFSVEELAAGDLEATEEEKRADAEAGNQAGRGPPHLPRRHPSDARDDRHEECEVWRVVGDAPGT